uniref:COesterase domain-containing protein n=1 Tax=Globodera pallida TaxID=36090 RepID=A0A183BIK0_GLOPA
MSSLKDQQIKCVGEVVGDLGKENVGAAPPNKSILKNPTALSLKKQQKKLLKSAAGTSVGSAKKTSADSQTLRKETLKSVAFGRTTRLENTLIAQQAEIAELRAKVDDLIASADDQRRSREEKKTSDADQQQQQTGEVNKQQQKQNPEMLDKGVQAIPERTIFASPSFTSLRTQLPASPILRTAKKEQQIPSASMFPLRGHWTSSRIRNRTQRRWTSRISWWKRYSDCGPVPNHDTTAGNPPEGEFARLIQTCLRDLEDEDKYTRETTAQLADTADKWMALRTNMTGAERIQDNPLFDDFVAANPYPQTLKRLRDYSRSMRSQRRPTTPNSAASTPNTAPSIPEPTPDFVVTLNELPGPSVPHPPPHPRVRGPSPALHPPTTPALTPPTTPAQPIELLSDLIFNLPIVTEIQHKSSRGWPVHFYVHGHVNEQAFPKEVPIHESFHGNDLNYVFNGSLRQFSFSAQDKQIEDFMVEAFRNFIKKGNPSTSDSFKIHWPRVSCPQQLEHVRIVHPPTLMTNIDRELMKRVLFWRKMARKYTEFKLAREMPQTK